jgi:hypothetical protein
MRTVAEMVYAPRYRNPCPGCDYAGCLECGGTGFAPVADAGGYARRTNGFLTASQIAAWASQPAEGAKSMKKSEAMMIVARLMAAFPTPLIDHMTYEVYVEYLRDLDYDRCLDTVNGLIRTQTWRPSIALILEAYERQAAS